MTRGRGDTLSVAGFAGRMRVGRTAQAALAVVTLGILGAGGCAGAREATAPSTQPGSADSAHETTPECIAPAQEAVRRGFAELYELKLEAALAHYEHALELDPGNEDARRGRDLCVRALSWPVPENRPVIVDSRICGRPHSPQKEILGDLNAAERALETGDLAGAESGFQTALGKIRRLPSLDLEDLKSRADDGLRCVEAVRRIR